MKYIFLDIDGVLSTDFEFWTNTQEFWLENIWAKKLKVPYPFYYKCVNEFNKILIEVSDIKIILSSDWRKHWNLEELDIIFKSNGVIQSPSDITKTDGFSNWDMLERTRMGDIESYLISNDLIDSNWIIIDDLNVRGFLPEEHKDKFFLTNSFDGLSEEGIVERIIEKLNSYETK